MKIRVKVKARSKVERIEGAGDGPYKVWVKAVPENGKANEAVIKILSAHFGVPKRAVAILSGHASPNKIIVIST